mgnify:FL=1
MNFENIKNKLISENLDAYLIGYGNRFIGQDVLPEEHKLQYVCGFSGSAGMLAVTSKQAYLFVDGRYELQARQEVDLSNITVINKAPCLKNVCAFLKEFGCGLVGYDGMSVSALELKNVRDLGLKLKDVGDWVNINSLTKINLEKRSLEYAGLASSDKMQPLKRLLTQNSADYYLLTAVDSVSWLLNIYAKDLPCSPVVRAYAVIGKNGLVTLVGDNLQTELPVLSFVDFEKWLAENSSKKFIYDQSSTPVRLQNLLKNSMEAMDVCQVLKAEKNETELAGMIACHKRDGVALIQLLYWLDNNWKGKTELDVVEKLHEFRQQQNLFFSESFETIAGTAENGAIVHYQPTIKTNKILQENSLLLLDSGGQYLDGTTDVTRTIALGQPTSEMIHDFTLVLKGHIALSQAVFPEGTCGLCLDALARRPLWREGKDFKHGTGHGVGCFGNVHEGPNRISSNGSLYGFKKNMITSIEPGYYKENAYGIRIENLVYSKVLSEHENYLEFEPLTLVPIDKRLIDVYLLDSGERDWLNNYHRKVYESLAACVNDNVKKWLKASCSPL